MDKVFVLYRTNARDPLDLTTVLCVCHVLDAAQARACFEDDVPFDPTRVKWRYYEGTPDTHPCWEYAVPQRHRRWGRVYVIERHLVEPVRGPVGVPRRREGSGKNGAPI